VRGIYKSGRGGEVGEPLKIIFPAIRGNGNTTELNKLAESIKREDEIFVVMFVAKEYLLTKDEKI